MKSNLYLQAAERQFIKGGWSCNNIYYANDFKSSNEEFAYQNMFEVSIAETFTQKLKDEGEENLYDLQEIRLLALCLAAAVVKSEKKSFARSVFGEKFKKQ